MIYTSKLDNKLVIEDLEIQRPDRARETRQDGAKGMVDLALAELTDKTRRKRSSKEPP